MGGRAAEVETVTGERAEIDDDTILLRDPSGDPVVRYSQAGGLRILVMKGDLTLSAPQGRVVIEAEAIEMRASRWRTHVERVSHTAGRWELRAERAVENAKDVYRACEGLLQVRAERIRNVVNEAYEVVAKRASITSEEETKIDGKRVLLG